MLYEYVFWEFFKKLYTTINKSISCNVANFFLLKEHSNGNWALKEHSKGSWALGHSKGIEELEHLRCLGTRRELGHSDTQGNWVTGHSGSWRTLGHSGTQEFRYLVTRCTLFSRLLFYVSPWVLEGYNTRFVP